MTCAGAVPGDRSSRSPERAPPPCPCRKTTLMFSTPRPSRRTPRSPDAFPFPRRRWAAAAAAALALGSLSACGPGTDGAAGGSRVSATTGAGGTDGGSGATAPGDVHRLALPLPEEVGTLRLEGLWPFTTHEKLLKQ